MSIRDKIKGTLDMAIRYYESLLEEGKPPSAAMAHTIDKYSAIMLAIEHPTKIQRICVMQGGMCSDRQKDGSCTCDAPCTYQDERPATIADLTRVE